MVPEVTYCGGMKPGGVSGCATYNGTRIALDDSVFDDPSVQAEIVVFHEMGHTKGLEHDDSDPGNLMRENTSELTVGIRKDQCPNFSVGKQYVTPDPWEDY